MSHNNSHNNNSHNHNSHNHHANIQPSRQSSKAINASHQSILDLLQDRTGLIFPKTRQDEVISIMDKGAQSANLSLADYATRLSNDEAFFDELCSRVTIAETYFFRDPKQFEFVRQLVLPAWTLSQANRKEGSPTTPFQVWSAGCSTGEEPYSLAILFDQLGLSGGVQLTATDLCKESLTNASRAQYGPWSLRTSDQNFCHNYFEQKDSRYHLKERYASTVRFAHLNLAGEISSFNSLGLNNLDLIFCRNVLIYFEREAIAKVIKTIHSLLKPGGYLVLGPSDPPANQFANFETVVCEWGVFYKKSSGDAAPIKLHTSKPEAHPAPLSQRKHQGHVNKLQPKPGAIPLTGTEMLTQAQTAYNQGQYEKAFSLTGHSLENPTAAVLHIKALANFSGSAPAEKVLKKLLEQHVGCFHLQYLHGHLLLDLGQLDLARAALKRCLFLDAKATMAHFSLALVQKRLGDRTEAQRSFRNVLDLCKNLPPDDVLPYGDGERVKILAQQATAELVGLSQV